MSDVAGAPAAAPSGVPIDTSAPQIPTPAETSNIAPKGDEVTTGQPPSAKERRSLDDIISAAHEKVTKDAEAKEKAAPKPAVDTKAKPEPVKADAKPEPAKAARQQGPDGKFVSAKPAEAPAAQQQQQATKPATGQHAEAPTRFSADAKAEWASAPESVRAEVHRMHREFDAGFTKYKAGAEAYETVKDFDEFAKAHGGNLRQVLVNYSTLEHALVKGDDAAKDNALAKVFQRAGINQREWAAKLLGQPVDQKDAAHHSELTTLRNEIAGLKKAVGNVTTTIHEQKASAITEGVTVFAKDPAHPRFDELWQDIAFFLKSDKVPANLPQKDRLQKAYELAERLNPSAASAAPLTPEHKPASDAGTKSIAGSPANGSDPSIPAKKKGQRTSIDDAIARARARVAAS